MKKNTSAKLGQKIRKIDLLKNWLLSGKTITSRQCSIRYGYDRAADGIWKLRRAGMNIDTEMKAGVDRFNNPVEYAVYRWAGEKPKIRLLKKNELGNLYSFTHVYPITVAKIKKRVQEFLKKEKVAKWVHSKKHSRMIAYVGRNYRIFTIKQKK